jgi:hypothetical protein
MRRFLVVLVPLALLVSSVAAATLLLRTAGDDMTRAAERFLASLEPEQKSKAALEFDSLERTKWHFIPLPERKGLQIKEMKPEQPQEALALLRSCVSEVGYHKAEVIMGLEAILRELEKTRTGGPIRDPERYYWVVYGKPEPIGSWGLSIEGHHLSLNFVVKDGKLSSFTPSFFGANPAIVHSHVTGGAPVGTRILDKEEVLAFELLGSLDADQRKLAVIAAEAPKDVRSAGEVQPPQTAPEGLPGKQLKPEQLKTLEALLHTYLNNMPAEIAEARKDEVAKSGLENAYFAWAGADKPGIGHYYRVQGPTYLVEFVNVQPDAAGNPANHIHALWRDLRGDFGLPIAK